MTDGDEPTPVQPAPLEYGRPAGHTAGEQIGGGLALVGGLAIGPVAVFAAGVGTVMLSDKQVSLVVIGIGWFVVAVALGYAIYRLVRRTRSALPLTRILGRSFVLGLLIGGMLAALCEGTCFVGFNVHG